MKVILFSQYFPPFSLVYSKKNAFTIVQLKTHELVTSDKYTHDLLRCLKPPSTDDFENSKNFTVKLAFRLL